MCISAYIAADRDKATSVTGFPIETNEQTGETLLQGRELLLCRPCPAEDHSRTLLGISELFDINEDAAHIEIQPYFHTGTMNHPTLHGYSSKPKSRFFLFHPDVLPHCK